MLIPVAIKNYGDKMSTFEQSEILDFPDVWFLGLEAKKIEGVPGAPQNNGTSFTIEGPGAQPPYVEF